VSYGSAGGAQSVDGSHEGSPVITEQTAGFIALDRALALPISSEIKSMTPSFLPPSSFFIHSVARFPRAQ
jgi:hypothetical protein